MTKQALLAYNQVSLGDGTHPKKQQANAAKGMKPIEKNIIVVDENGTVYESTWLKRANGLVKKGRARWLDEQTLCLACPPEPMEDDEMENRNQAEAATEPGAEFGNHSTLGGLTVERLLDRMDAIRKEMLSMEDLLGTMREIAVQAGEDDAGHVAEATSRAFAAREATCQQQLRFLEKIYDDHFAAPSEEAKMARSRMLLDKMNDFIPCMDYTEENGSGNIEALKVITAFYNDLLKQD